MKAKLSLSNYQIYCLLVMHSLGSSTLFARGIKAKQDAWIAEIVALIIGFAMIWIHTEIYKHYPSKNFAEVNILLLGKAFGGFLSIMYAFYFFWVSTLNFSEFSDLISIAALQTTPIVVIQIVFALLIVYLTFKDIEVLGRTSEIFMPIVILSIIFLYVLIAFSAQIHLDELKPILSNGIKPVLHEAFPTFSTFPYGEGIVFLMYYCYAKDPTKTRKSAMLAVLTIGIFLVLSIIMIISVLGVTFASSATIPFLELIRLINIADILTNLDAIGLIMIFIGGLFKAMLFFYGAVLTLSTIFNIKRKRVIIALAIFLVWFNLTTIPNFTYHRFTGIEFSNKYVQALYTLYIPILLLLIIKIKNAIPKKQLEENNEK